MSRVTLRAMRRIKKYPGDQWIVRAFGRALKSVREERGITLEQAEEAVQQINETTRDWTLTAKAVGIAVREARLQQELSVKQLAKLSGVDEDALEEIEQGSGRREIPLTDFCRIAYSVGLEPWQLVRHMEKERQRICGQTA